MQSGRYLKHTYLVWHSFDLFVLLVGKSNLPKVCLFEAALFMTTKPCADRQICFHNLSIEIEWPGWGTISLEERKTVNVKNPPEVKYYRSYILDGKVTVLHSHTIPQKVTEI